MLLLICININNVADQEFCMNCLYICGHFDFT